MTPLEQAEARAKEYADKAYPDDMEHDRMKSEAAYLACWRDMQSTPPAEHPHTVALREIYDITITSGALTSDEMVGIISQKSEHALSTPASVPAPDRLKNGFAPGSYQRKCHNCGCLFLGNKWAVTCEFCANYPRLAAPASPVTADEREAYFEKVYRFFAEWIKDSQAAGSTPHDFMRTNFPAQSPKVLPTREQFEEWAKERWPRTAALQRKNTVQFDLNAKYRSAAIDAYDHLSSLLDSGAEIKP